MATVAASTDKLAELKAEDAKQSEVAVAEPPTEKTTADDETSGNVDTGDDEDKELRAIRQSMSEMQNYGSCLTRIRVTVLSS